MQMKQWPDTLINSGSEQRQFPTMIPIGTTGFRGKAGIEETI